MVMKWHVNNVPRSSMLPGACDHLRDLSLSVSIQWQLVEADGNCKVAERKLLRCVPCLGLNRTGRPRRRFPYLCLKS